MTVNKLLPRCRRKGHIFSILILSIAVVALSATGTGANAEEDSYKEIKRLDLTGPLSTKSPWSLVIYQSTEYHAPTQDEVGSGYDKPLRLCFFGGMPAKEHCTDAKTTYPGGAGVAVEQTLSGVSILTISNRPKTRQVVETTTLSFYGGSGGLVARRLWLYSPEQDSFEIFNSFAIDIAGSEKIYNQGTMDGYLIYTDFYWGSGECHYCHHHYKINVYRILSNPDGRYVPILEYLTNKKYASISGNKVGGPDVIERELPTIKSLLSAAYGRPNFDWTEPRRSH